MEMWEEGFRFDVRDANRHRCQFLPVMLIITSKPCMFKDDSIEKSMIALLLVIHEVAELVRN